MVAVHRAHLARPRIEQHQVAFGRAIEDAALGVDATDALRAELVKHVRGEIGPIAAPDWLQWAPGLPKTRSGKIMRRILRKIAEAGPEDFAMESLGDISTLADPGVVETLVAARERRAPPA